MWWDITLITCMFLLSYAILRRKAGRMGRPATIWYLGALAVKLCAAFAVISFYSTQEKREDADVFKYFDDGHALYLTHQTGWAAHLGLVLGLTEADESHQAYLARTHQWHRPTMERLPNDNRVMIRIHALLHHISGGSIWIHAAFFCLLSFIGSIWIIEAFRRSDGSDPFFLVILTLTPTLLFWTSAPLKESLLILGLGAVLYAGRLIKDARWTRASVILYLGLVILSSVKSYVGLAMAPGLLLYLTRPSIRIQQLTALSMICLFIGLGFSPLGDATAETLSRKHNDFVRISRGGLYLNQGHDRLFIPDSGLGNITWVGTDSARIERATLGACIDMDTDHEEVKWLQPSSTLAVHLVTRKARTLLPWTPPRNGADMLVRAPITLARTLWQPIPNMAHGTAQLIGGLEQMILILLVSTGLWLGRKNFLNENLGLALAVMPLLLLIGYSVPVEGALVRYRMPVILLFLCMVQNSQGWHIKNWFSRQYRH